MAIKVELVKDMLHVLETIECEDMTEVFRAEDKLRAKAIKLSKEGGLDIFSIQKWNGDNYMGSIFPGWC